MYVNDVVQSIDPSSIRKTCYLLGKLPVYEATVGTFIRGKAMVCGGKTHRKDSSVNDKVRVCIAHSSDFHMSYVKYL